MYFLTPSSYLLLPIPLLPASNSSDSGPLCLVLCISAVIVEMTGPWFPFPFSPGSRPLMEIGLGRSLQLKTDKKTKDILTCASKH